MDSRLASRRSAKWTHYPPDVLPAWVAEMDFDLAPCVRDALIGAVELGDLGYIGNVDSLRAEFAGFMQRRLGWTVGPTALVCDVMVGIQEVVRHLRAERVVVTPPCYPPYFAEIPSELVEVPLLEDFSLDFEGLDRAFGAGARALVLCHPHNPTGRIAPVGELQRLASLADAWGVHVIADEIHAPLSFEAFTTWANVSENGTVLTSASKAFNLPALKLAFVVGAVAEELPEELQDHAGLLGVFAAEAAFRDGDDWLDQTIATIRSNHALVRAGLPDGVRVAFPPQAGYLTWLDCRELGDDPAQIFLDRGRVALYPGLRFGAPGAGFARLNVGTTPELVEEALRRLSKAR